MTKLKPVEIEEVTIIDEAMIPWLQQGDVVKYIPIRPGPEIGFLSGTMVAVETDTGKKIVRLYYNDDDGNQWLQPVNPKFQGENCNCKILGIVMPKHHTPRINMPKDVLYEEIDLREDSYR